ncbi:MULTISPECIES: PQQ-dependent sugar dehydrogenase [Exiguobacterium]|uniref:PQQ-dependent sugar dehydrogenase n=1 Tax=Exiguobacterium acetylicum TaxID=41170 RepID=A0ABX8G7A6_EXIAC|nr:MULTISPECIES: PQQ-dependent sugar dehydrogenase [Exiguobacterium]QWB29148.1 PQQ-dependent sugar dehydrogenase [Exiguobacterium acetylicum]
MKIRYVIPLLLTGILMGCTQTSEESSTEETNQTTQENNQQDSGDQEATQSSQAQEGVVFKELNAPWNIVREGEVFYITEREGTIVKGEQDDYERMRLQLKEDVLAEGEGGLLGMVLDPDFKDNKTAYVYHTYAKQGQATNRVIAIKEEGDQWTEERVLLDDIPGATIHNGGRLEWGPEGALYVTAGDAANPELAQDIDSLAGKILRITSEGKPFEGNQKGYVYSLGHRNPQGLVFVDDQLYASEHGQSGHDEINRIEQKNYGWPTIEGKEQAEGLVTPWYEVGEQSVAPSGVATAENTLYFATLVGQRLQTIDLETKQVKTVVENQGRIRDVWIDETSIYYITNNTDGRGNPSADDDRLVRINR